MDRGGRVGSGGGRGVAGAAEAAPGFMPAEEGLALYARGAGPSGAPLLEIGTYCGKSTIYLAAAAARTRHDRGHRGPPPRLARSTSPAGSTTTPRWWTRAPGGSTRCPRCAARCTGPGWRTTWSPVVGRSAAVAAWWTTPVGLVFIDGGHTEEAAAADYRGWVAHLVRRRGAGHPRRVPGPGRRRAGAVPRLPRRRSRVDSSLRNRRPGRYGYCGVHRSGSVSQSTTISSAPIGRLRPPPNTATVAGSPASAAVASSTAPAVQVVRSTGHRASSG